MTTAVHPLTPPSLALSAEDLAYLRRFTSPTIANAIESLGGQRPESYSSKPAVRCLFPDLGPAVGFACTAAILSTQPAAETRRVHRLDYWKYVRAAPPPKLLVVQDLSDPVGGAYWGEVNCSIHRALGCSGVLTNGTVRDIEECRALGFHLFAGGVTVSHELAHLEDFARPVKIFGMLVYPGDLVHADRHGAVIVPRDSVQAVIEMARAIERDERVILDLCRSEALDLHELDKLVSPGY